MSILIAAIPLSIFFGLAVMAVYCLLTDKDMPLYNKGHCDRYSVGTFYW